MNILYDNLINRSRILDKLNINLIISNVIIIKNDPVNKSDKFIKNYNGKKDYESIENIIVQTYKFKDRVIELKEYFNNIFDQANNKKIQFNIQNKISEILVKCYLFFKFRLFK